MTQRSESVVGAVRRLLAAYGKTTEIERGAAYAQALSDLPPEVVGAAVDAAIATSRWLPSVAELRGLVVEHRLRLATPEVAWAEVLSEIRRCGRWHPRRWSSHAIAEAVRAVGWDALCEMREPAVTRAHFVRAYTETRAAAVRAAHAAQVCERLERAVGQLDGALSRTRALQGRVTRKPEES